jgi:ferric-dicitrate binding protein FerR (iron transport regulator)
MNPINRRSFLCVVGSLLAITFSFMGASNAAEDPTPQTAGSVEEASGETFAQAAEKRRLLKQAAPIFVSDRVGTGPDSRLELRLGENTMVRLGERAQLTINEFLANAGGKMTLDAGAMLFDKRAGQPMPVEIRGSFGVIAVQGTRFFAGQSNKVFGVFVEEGSVAVTAGGRRVVLRAGEGTDIARPGARPTAPKRWGKPRIDAAYASVR